MEKTYGPYQRKDGRSHVIIYDSETKQRRTQSYPRYLMERHLGRDLTLEEHVDHINNNPSDNRLENFQILSVGDNIRKSAKPAEVMSFVCPVCERPFEKLARRYREHQIVQKKSGPYCSKSCAGKAGH